MSSFLQKIKGIHTNHFKNTKDINTNIMPVPQTVRILMSQHMGPPCVPLVKAGDVVKAGQLIADSDAFLSAPIHSGVSGKVLRIENIVMPNGTSSKAVVITADEIQEQTDGISPPIVKSREDFIKAVKASGIVGLGGAGFPTHIKLNPKNMSEIDTLIINAAECEPFITSDYRTMMEEADNVIDGINAILHWLEIPKCVIGIEDNKPKAIELLGKKTADLPNVSVMRLKSQYPQGAEKVLIYSTKEKVLPEGKLPADVGVIVINVTTAANIAKYLKTGIPLTTKRITVDGNAVTNPQNVEVVIGTAIHDVIEHCGGYSKPPAKILMGGPMMGIAMNSDSYPILKNSNAILVFDEKQAETKEESACIRCGRCANVCPLNLMPLHINDASEREDIDGLKKLKVNLCMECGCCDYSCPAKRYLVHVNRLAKARIRKAV